MNVDTTAIRIILLSNELCFYLDHHSVIESTLCNTSLHSIFAPHIQDFFTFSIPIFALTAQAPTKFLKIYKNAKRINNNFNTSQITKPRLPFSVVIPSQATHYTGLSDMMIHFPPSLTHLHIVSSSSFPGPNKFPPKITHYTNEKRFYKRNQLNQVGDLDTICEIPPTAKVVEFHGKLVISAYLPPLTHLLCGTNTSIHLQKLKDLNSMRYLKLPGLLNCPIDNVPPNLTYLEAGFQFNQPVDNLPLHLKILKLNGKFNQKIDHLPSLLTHLYLELEFFDHSLDFLPSTLIFLRYITKHRLCIQKADNLPLKLKYLELNCKWRHPVDHLPPSLSHLIFVVIPSHTSQDFWGKFFWKPVGKAYFNMSVDNLPPINHLKLSYLFNNKADFLPNSVTTLTFGPGFNKPLDHLPSSIIYLTFGDGFNQPVDHLPVSITHVSFGSKFNQLVDFLPSHLTLLRLGTNFNQNIDHLPPFLRDLYLGSKLSYSIDNLPLSLKKLKIHIPNNVERNVLFSFDNLPPILASITLYRSFNETVDYLPLSLKKVSFGHIFNQNVDNLPTSVQSLKFSGVFNQSVDHLPRSVTFLSISSYFNRPIDHLPNKLCKLILIGKFNQKVDNLPDSLVSLKISGEFYRPLNFLPSFLRKLDIEGTIDMKINVTSLPSSLTHLISNVPVSPLEALPNLSKYKVKYTYEGEV